MIYPFSEVPKTSFQQNGGLVFLTSPSVSKIEVAISLDAASGVESFLDVDVTVDAKGPATIAIVGSGPGEFTAAAMTKGTYNGLYGNERGAGALTP